MLRSVATVAWLAMALSASGCDLPGGATETTETTDTTPATAPAAEAPRTNAVVDWVIDGDTIDVIIDGTEDRVRLIGIDTPEKSIEERGQVADCFGDEATEFTRSLIPAGTAIRLERDIEPRDDYGRLLAYVYRENGVFVNHEIVRHGYAQPLTIAPNVSHAELFVEAARQAERDDAGLWAACR